MRQADMPKIDPVFVVSSAIYHEGGNVIGVAATIEGAKRIAAEDARESDNVIDLDWKPVHGVAFDQRRALLAMTADHPSESRYTYWEIAEMTVQP